MIEKELKILIVEDNISDEILIKRQIKKIVVNPITIHAHKLSSIKHFISTFEPDVILCDYQLNGFTGFDVLNHVNKLEVHIPLIFLTGTINDEEIAASSILTGATGYILKKNINSLHVKLLPYFEEIISKKGKVKITKQHRKVLDDLENYLNTVKKDSDINKASFLELKKALEKIKSVGNDSE